MLERLIRWRGKKNGINWLADPVYQNEYEALNRWGAGIPEDGPLAELDREMNEHLRAVADPAGDLPRPALLRRAAPVLARLFFMAMLLAFTVLVVMAGRRGSVEAIMLGMVGMLVCAWYLGVTGKGK